MMARNNIFNIRASRQAWQGQRGSCKGFCKFEDRWWCIRAWVKLMQTYRIVHGCKTIRQIVTRFAPPTENHTDLYIDYVCKRVKLLPDEPLTCKDEYVRLAKAMAWMETNSEVSESTVRNVMESVNFKVE